MTRHIPNIITLLNLASGCIALVFAARDNYEFAFYFVCLGIFLDFFDGFFARMLNAAGPLGLQLDSLADMVTSGVVPGYVMYSMLGADKSIPEFVPYLGFIITLGSCYRLAKFNIDTRQTDSFIGLPTPANALFIISLALVKQNADSLLLLEMLLNPWVLLLITLLSAYMMNAEIPLFSLKTKKFSWADNKLRYIFLAIAVLLIVLLQVAAIPLIILIYVLLSVINNRFAQN